LGLNVRRAVAERGDDITTEWSEPISFDQVGASGQISLAEIVGEGAAARPRRIFDLTGSVCAVRAGPFLPFPCVDMLHACTPCPVQITLANTVTRMVHVQPRFAIFNDTGVAYAPALPCPAVWHPSHPSCHP
jgi:hypothetical protein